MIKLSTKIRYALRLMIYLAKNQGNTIYLKDIAEDEKISFKYLEQIIPYLKSSGLVISRRGAKGGYTLAKKPSEISVKDIFQSIEGPIALSDCVINPEICDRTSTCHTKKLWEKLNKQLLTTLEAITLEDLKNDKINLEVS